MSLTIVSNSPSIISMGNINKNNLPLQMSWKWAYANTLWSLWRLCKQSWFVFCLQFHQCKLYLCSVFYFESIELKLTLFHNYKHSFWLTDKSCWNFIPRAITLKWYWCCLVSLNFLLWNCITNMNLHSLVSLCSCVICLLIIFIILFYWSTLGS